MSHSRSDFVVQTKYFISCDQSANQLRAVTCMILGFMSDIKVTFYRENMLNLYNPLFLKIQLQ